MQILNWILNRKPEPLDYKAKIIGKLKLNGLLLSSASEIIKNDKDCVLVAVSESGTALKYASIEL